MPTAEHDALPSVMTPVVINNQPSPNNVFDRGVQGATEVVRSVGALSGDGLNRVLAFILTVAVLVLAGYFMRESMEARKESEGQLRAMFESEREKDRLAAGMEADKKRQHELAVLKEQGKMMRELGEVVTKMTVAVNQSVATLEEIRKKMKLTPIARPDE